MQGKTIVITGAFGVLGGATARRAKEQGWTVALIDHAPAPQDEFTKSCIVLHGVDLTDLDAATRAMQSVREATGRVDALLNIAGGFVWEKLEDGAPETWARMFRLNLQTAVTACKAALPHLVASGAGAIVNVGAYGALKAGAGMGPYAASKAGVLKLTESLADEHKGKVRVNAVLPTTLDTPQNRADMPDADPARWIAPSDLADVMLFLASDASRAVSGALIPVVGRSP